MIFVAAEFRTQSTSNYPQFRQNIGRRESVTLLMCFNSALKGLFPEVERKTKSTEILATSYPGTLQRFHGHLLLARRYYLSPNSIRAAGFLFPPGVNCAVNIRIDEYHAKHLFLPHEPGHDEPVACSEEGVGHKS